MNNASTRGGKVEFQTARLHRHRPPQIAANSSELKKVTSPESPELFPPSANYSDSTTGVTVR